MNSDVTTKKLPQVWIPTKILYSPALDPYDLKVLMVIISHCNRITKKCFPSIPTIAKEANLAIGTVKRCRTNLKKYGLISWRVKKQEKNSCQYELPVIQDPLAAIAKLSEYRGSGRGTTRRGRVAAQPDGKVAVRPLGRAVGQPANYKKEQKKLTTNRVVVVLNSFLSPFSKTVHKKAQELIIKLQKWGFTSEAIVEMWQNSHRHYLAVWVHDIDDRVREGNVHNPGGYLRQVLKNEGEPQVRWDIVMARWKFKEGRIMEGWLYGHNHPDCLADKLEPKEFFKQIELKLEETNDEGGE